MASLLAVFAEFERDILRERMKAGRARARKAAKQLGRSRTAGRKARQDRELYAAGMNKSAIARRLSIGRTSGCRFVEQKGWSRRSWVGCFTLYEFQRMMVARLRGRHAPYEATAGNGREITPALHR